MSRAASAGTVTITNPAAGASISSPLDVHATYSASAKYMKLWVDHSPSAVELNTNVFDEQVSLGNGAHIITVQALDSTNGQIYSDTANVIVGTVSSGSHTVTITSPSNGGILSSPVDVHATYDASVTAKYMKLWLDHQPNGLELNTNVFDEQVSLTNGAHVITVQALDGSNLQIYSSTENITVGSSAATVTVSPASATLSVGGTQQFTAADSAGLAVTWSATGGTITSSGLYTAGTTAGTFAVTATDSNNNSGTAAITVVSSAATITVSPTSVTLSAGGTQQFTATDSAGLGVTWSATGGTITSSGLYTAGTIGGTFAVTATDSNNNNGTASVTIQNSVPTVTLQSPPNGATVTSPANVHATYNGNATYMKLWVDGKPGTFELNTNVFNASVSLSAGTHVIKVQAEDASTGVFYASSASDITVAPGGGGANGGTVQSYTTWKNDNARTGQQLNETTLTPSNVNSSQFGIVFSDSVDGQVFAQPLYLANQTMADGIHNVVYVATEHDSVYAFDADGGGSPLWQTSLLPSGATTVPQSLVHSTIFPEIGITGTPVIDPSAGILYVVAESLENNNVVFRLHALSVITGQEEGGSPVVIDASGWQPLEQLQRPGLLLANGNIYIGFGSQGDTEPYNGWIFAYSAESLAQVGTWEVTTTTNQGGVWMAGSGLAADPTGNIYAMTANGHWDGIADFADSFIEVSPNLGTVLGSYSPANQALLGANDLDLGSGGVLLVPDQSGTYPHEVIGCGKYPALFILNRDDMSLLQELDNAVGASGSTKACYMTPAYWEQNIYFIANGDVVKAFTLNASTGQLSTSPTSQGSYVFGFPGAQPVVSSNGSSDGILWAVEFSKTAAVLHAFDATDVSKELYRSGTLGPGVKWAVPTVVNGKVYVGTASTLVVFGPQ